MNKSNKSCIFLGLVPLVYYLFDYISTIYTKMLYGGTDWTFQIIPSTISVLYFIFMILYYTEIQKQASIQMERDMLMMQLRHAHTEFSSLKQLQENAATYRHDMRHHFAYLHGLASKEEIEKIKEYLQTAKSDIDAITPVRFCENETINLILSSFATKAKQSETKLEIDVKLPCSLTFSDTELCSILSNTLENAIHACESISDINQRFIRLLMYCKNNKLCIDIRNHYHIEPMFYQGLPVSKEAGHGFGTKSIVNIFEKHGGVCQFLIQDGWFIFQATA